MSLTVRNNVFSKGWKRYMIMHKNRTVASVREDGTEGGSAAFVRFSQKYHWKHE